MKKIFIIIIMFFMLFCAGESMAYTQTNFRVDWKEIYVEVPLNANMEEYKNNFIVNVYVDEVLLLEGRDYYIVVGINGTSTSTINTNVTGRHRIDAIVTLYEYNASSINTITYNVVDEEGPEFSTSTTSIVTKHGVKPDYVSFFEAYDNSGKDVTITVDETFVDYNLVGEHTAIIKAKDVNGNITEIIVTVYVVDTFAPRITLKKILNISIGTTINVSDYFYGYDDYDKDITHLIKVESYDNTVLGEQQIYVSLEDSSGNYTRVQFTLTIVDDTPPVIYFNTSDAKVDIAQDITYDLFKNFIMYVEDDGNTLDASLVKIDFSTVLNELGTYTVIYYVTDSAGNTAETRLSVRVVQTSGPEIICRNITIKSGDTFDETLVNNYITVYDQYDTTAANTLKVDLTGVNLGIAGVYMVLVSACNSSGIFTYETLMITVEGNSLFDFSTYWPLTLILLAPAGYYGYQYYMKKQAKKYEE